jgi:hypothetical protein
MLSLPLILSPQISSVTQADYDRETAEIMRATNNMSLCHIEKKKDLKGPIVLPLSAPEFPTPAARAAKPFEIRAFRLFAVCTLALLFLFALRSA